MILHILLKSHLNGTTPSGEGPKILKVGDTFTTPFGLILIFFVRTPSGQSACQIWNF